MKYGKTVGNSVKLLLLHVTFTVHCRAAFFYHTLTFTNLSSHTSAFLSVVNCLIVLCSAIVWSTVKCASAVEYEMLVANRLLQYYMS
jgi:hypothetical protein